MSGISQEIRRAFTAFSWLTFERAFRLLVGTGVTFVVARHLGPAEWGHFSYALAVVALLSFLPELGLEEILKREFIQHPESRDRILGTAFTLRLVATLPAGILLGCLSFTGSVQSERSALLILGVLLFRSPFLIHEALFLSKIQTKPVVLAQSVATAAGAILKLGLVYLDADIVAFAWAMVIETAFQCLTLWSFARKKFGNIRSWRFDPNLAGSLVRRAWPLALAALATLVYLRIDAVMLRHLLGAEAVGIYTAAVRFSELTYFLPMAAATIVLPSLLAARNRGSMHYERFLRGYLQWSAGGAVVVCLIATPSSSLLIQFAYGPDFASAADVLSIHIWGTIFVFLGVARGQYLINENLTSFYLAATAAGAVTNVALNWMLIPYFGPRGAAITTVISFALAGVISSFFHPQTRTIGRWQLESFLFPLTILRSIFKIRSG